MYRFVVGSLAFVAFFATSAAAEVSLVTPAPGYTYYNRQGASLAEHDADLRICLDEASRLVQPHPPAAATGDPFGALAAQITRSVIHSQAERRGLVANITNCMILRGWRLVRVNSGQGGDLSRLEPTQLAARLAPWVGAADPEGEIVRTFTNEITFGETDIVGRAGDLDKVPLSIAALAQAESAPTETTPAGRQAARYVSALRQNEVAALPEDSTLVVVNLIARSGSTVAFARIGEGNIAPTSVDGLPDHFTAILPQTAFGTARMERTFFFSVPPGKWRIDELGIYIYRTSLCMGAPFFELAQGDVVFMQIDLTAAVRAPAFSAEAVRGLSASVPAHVSARARAASFTNGATFRCGGSSAFYAWEVPDAPFADDYRLGSRAGVLPLEITSAEASDVVSAVPQSAQASEAPDPTSNATP